MLLWHLCYRLRWIEHISKILNAMYCKVTSNSLQVWTILLFSHISSENPSHTANDGSSKYTYSAQCQHLLSSIHITTTARAAFTFRGLSNGFRLLYSMVHHLTEVKNNLLYSSTCTIPVKFIPFIQANLHKFINEY